MPDQPKTPHRTFRIDDALWADFTAEVQAAGSDASTVVRAFMAWYAGYPNTTRPTRPPKRSETSPTAGLADPQTPS